MTKKQHNLVCWFDFTINNEWVDNKMEKINIVLPLIKKIFKIFKFKCEIGMGINKYKHLQGRGSSKTKTRLTALKKIMNYSSHGCRWSITSKEKINNFDYIDKNETTDSNYTRIWENERFDIYIPRKFRREYKDMYPLQKQIFNSMYIYDDRLINNVYDPETCSGKSTIAGILMLKYNGVIIPFCDNPERIMYDVMNECKYRKLRNNVIVFLDLPYTVNNEKISKYITAIEVIKEGLLYDTRNRGQKYQIECPMIWIFSNNKMPKYYCKRKGFKLWDINYKTMELVAKTATNWNGLLEDRKQSYKNNWQGTDV